jgi:hypothetical protein
MICARPSHLTPDAAPGGWADRRVSGCPTQDAHSFRDMGQDGKSLLVAFQETDGRTHKALIGSMPASETIQIIGL